MAEYTVDRAVPVSRSMLALLLAVSLVLGGAMWLNLGGIQFLDRPRQSLLVGVLLASIVLAARPKAGETLWLARRRIDRALRRRSITVSLVLGLLVCGYYGWLFVSRGSDPRPGMSDEFSYLIQAQFLARGTLASPAHPHPDFFTTFQFVAEPFYGSIYFPGTAIWYLPWAVLDGLIGDGVGQWIWPGSLLATAGAIVLSYHLAARLLGATGGLFVALLIAQEEFIQAFAFMITGQAPALFLGVATAYCGMRWHDAIQLGRRAWPWAILAGTATAWGMLVRPVDALAWALPTIALVLLTRTPWRRKFSMLGLALLPILPLAALQLSFNQSAMGSLTTTPFSWYAETHLPGSGYGFDQRAARDARPPDVTAHYQESYRQWAKPILAQRRLAFGDFALDRAIKHLTGAFPAGLMQILIPPALLWLMLSRRRALASLIALPWLLALGLYLPYGFYLTQYANASVPSLAVTMVLGLAGLSLAVQKLWPTRGRSLEAAVSVAGGGLLVIAASVYWLPPIADDSPRPLDRYNAPKLRAIDAAIEGRSNALVFITPPMPNRVVHMEAVYNLGVLHPDDAEVIRAHDLGERNLELVEYFAATQSDREVLHLDQETMNVTNLGTAASLAVNPGATRQRFLELSAPWRDAYATEQAR